MEMTFKYAESGFKSMTPRFRFLPLLEYGCCARSMRQERDLVPDCGADCDAILRSDIGQPSPEGLAEPRGTARGRTGYRPSGASDPAQSLARPAVRHPLLIPGIHVQVPDDRLSGFRRDQYLDGTGRLNRGAEITQALPQPLSGGLRFPRGRDEPDSGRNRREGGAGMGTDRRRLEPEGEPDDGDNRRAREREPARLVALTSAFDFRD